MGRVRDVLKVRKGKELYPFSKGILARSIVPTGMPIEKVYEIIREIMEELQKKGKEEVSSDIIRDMVSRKLKERGFQSKEKYYRISRKIAKIQKPIIILIGGAPGVGKSGISAELAHRLGIERFINTDAIREIMRYMIPPDLMPVLHASSFEVNSHITHPNPPSNNNLLFGFAEQTNLVCQGVRAFIKRMVKEGLKTIIDGVHLIPGYLELEEEIKRSTYIFHFILHLSNREEHIERFRLRARGSKREPDRYIEAIENIEEIQSYIRKRAEKHSVIEIDNNDFEETVEAMMKTITISLEKEVL
jgi:2-phosphoglycerate kinase